MLMCGRPALFMRASSQNLRGIFTKKKKFHPSSFLYFHFLPFSYSDFDSILTDAGEEEQPKEEEEAKEELKEEEVKEEEAAPMEEEEAEKPKDYLP